jgi:23S rRNA (adenine-N6)-dimethyltransferase
VSGHVPSGRSRRSRLGQHFLDSSRLASQIVADAGVTGDDRVVEIGAGRGALTDALANHAGQVLAFELDPKLVSILAQRFASADNVAVFRADARDVPLPANPYRVLANLPFGVTSAVLRRLLDVPASGLRRADLIVQWQVARERVRAAGGPPTDLLGARWGPWWEFRRRRRLPAACFRPRPSVDAAVLVVTRRTRPLLPTSASGRYSSFVAQAFRSRADARDLGVDQWIELFRVSDRRTSVG